MDEAIRARYSDAILHAALRRYGIAADQIQPLNAFESFIYAFERSPHAYILRLSHTLRRSEALIQGEVDWINHLADGGVSVARAVLSDAGRLVEAVDDGQGGQFLATAFVKAHGRPPWDHWTPTLLESYGRLLGKVHARTRGYQPANPAWRRPEWNDPSNAFVDLYLPESEAGAWRAYQAVGERLAGLPRDDASYGLIHQDAHGGNFLVDEAGTLTLFDFDDCVYSWFVNDIAIALFYTVQDAEDWTAFTREFLTHFWRGYREAYALDPRWLREIPVFLKLRELELYAVIHRDFDVSAIDHAWIARFMRDRRDKIEQGAPFIDFDFAAFAESA